MKSILIAAGLLSSASHAFSEAVNFDADAIGQPPTGWTCGATGGGRPPGPRKAGVWIKADSVTLFDDFSYAAGLSK